MKSKKLYIESFLVLILTLFVVYLIYLLSFNINLFNVLKKSYKKIDLYDLYYSELKSKETGISKDIILVNIGNYDRKEIASMLTTIHRNSPKVIGLDVMFEKFTNSKKDSILRESLNLIKDKTVFSYDYNHPDTFLNREFKLQNLNRGYSNFEHNKNEAIRYIRIQKTEGENHQYSFAYQIVKQFNSKLIEEKEKELQDKPSIINYTGGYNRFFPIEGSDLIDNQDNLDLFKDKIVIVGFFGEYFNSVSHEDKHFTPMGKHELYADPDMHGGVIHANIIQMMLDGSYITYWSNASIVFGIISMLLVYPFIVIFTYYFVRRHLWFHIAAKLIQFALGAIIIFLLLNLYEYGKIKIDLKFFLLILAVSVDILYLYEALAVIIYKKFRVKSYFIHEH